MYGLIRCSQSDSLDCGLDLCALEEDGRGRSKRC